MRTSKLSKSTRCGAVFLCVALTASLSQPAFAGQARGNRGNVAKSQKLKRQGQKRGPVSRLGLRGRGAHGVAGLKARKGRTGALRAGARQADRKLLGTKPKISTKARKAKLEDTLRATLFWQNLATTAEVALKYEMKLKTGLGWTTFSLGHGSAAMILTSAIFFVSDGMSVTEPNIIAPLYLGVGAVLGALTWGARILSVSNEKRIEIFKSGTKSMPETVEEMKRDMISEAMDN